MKPGTSAKLTILAVFACTVLLTAGAAMAKTSAECGGDVPANTEPPSFVSIKIYRVVDPNGQQLGTFPDPIPIGSRITLDATPKDASRKPTQASKEGIIWKFTGTDGAFDIIGDDECFNPKIRVLGAGVLSVSATADGAPSDPKILTINFGEGSTENTFCARKDEQGKYHCITGTQDDLECDDPSTVERCGLSPCERKSLDDCVGGGPAVTNPILTPTANPSDLGQLINFVFSWSLRIIGIVVFVMILYNGFMWLTAAGNPNQIGKAWNGMTNAILGAVLLLAAYLILSVINPNLVKQASTLPALPGSTSK